MQTNRRGLLLALMSIFLLPLILAVLVYFHHPSFVNRTTNHGHLISPEFSVSDMKLKDESDVAIDPHLFQGKWVMVFVESDGCTDRCEKKLYEMRQIRIALNKDSGRIDRVIVTYDDSSTARIRQLTAEKFVGTQHVIATKKVFQQLFSRDPALAPYSDHGGILLIDPHGNVMMSYDVDSNPKFIFEDLQHLLNASQIG